MSRKPCTHYVIYRNYGSDGWKVSRIVTPSDYTHFWRDHAKRFSRFVQIRKITHTVGAVYNVCR